MFGVNIVNEEGRRVLSNETKVMKLFAEGTITSSSTPIHSAGWSLSPGAGFLIDIPVPSGIIEQAALVFIQPLNNVIAPVFDGPGGIVFPFKYVATSPGVAVKYRVYYPAMEGALDSGEQWGMEIYGPNGETYFSTRHEIMEVADVVDQNPPVELFPDTGIYAPPSFLGGDAADNYGPNEGWSKSISHEYCPDAYYCIHQGWQGFCYRERTVDAAEGYLYSLGLRQLDDYTLERKWGNAYAVGYHTFSTQTFAADWDGYCSTVNTTILPDNF